MAVWAKFGTFGTKCTWIANTNTIMKCHFPTLWLLIYKDISLLMYKLTKKCNDAG